MTATTRSALRIPKGGRIGLCEPETPPGPGCQPTVILLYSRSRDSDYRGACLGCGWIGGPRDDSNTAVEDAHDHTHPGWRDLPVFEMPQMRYDGKDAARLAKVEPRMRQLVPPDWPDRCGPVRAYRNHGATRHVAGRSPWGGYELAVVRDAAPMRDGANEQLRMPL